MRYLLLPGCPSLLNGLLFPLLFPTAFAWCCLAADLEGERRFLFVSLGQAHSLRWLFAFLLMSGFLCRHVLRK